MVKVTKVGDHQHVVTIPQELRKAMGWQKGDEVEFSVEDDSTLKMRKSQ